MGQRSQCCGERSGVGSLRVISWAWAWSSALVFAAGTFAACSGKVDGGPAVTDGAVAPDPGRVTLHRLNRVEYNNTMHDLFGTRQNLADDFPSDDRGYGYDNIADVLSLSPLLVDLYQQAAQKLIHEAIDLPFSTPTLLHFKAIDAKATVGAPYNQFWNLFSNGEVSTPVTLPAAGKYKISTRCFGQQAGPDLVRMSLSFDGLEVQQFTVPEIESAPGVYSVTVMANKGAHVFGVSFLNDFYNAMLKQDRNLIVDWLQIEGPLDLPPPVNPLRDRIMICDPVKDGAAPCAARIVKAFAHRAWRRPVTDEEVTRLGAFVDEAATEGDGFDQGIKLALEAILLSPHFIFRVELDTNPVSLTAHPLSNHELASRLSYFLWSSMPDDALLSAADQGQLSDPDKLAAEVTRMLADPRAEALVQNFAGQWLYTRGLGDHVIDSATFPLYDDALKLALTEETQTYFRDFLFKDAAMNQFLSSDYSYVNDRLAKHYGLQGSFGADLRKTTLPDERRGLLTQGSVLTVTSFPQRTSPVKRGKWVLEQMLCSGPPPPPPGVEGLMPEKIPTGTMRQRMEAHRNNPVCASCHKNMDPIGFGMETFDGIGLYRTTDSGFPIDATGQLPDGQKFNGARALSQLLATDPRFFACVTQQLYVYALGRGPEIYDGERLDSLTNDFTTRGYHLRDLILAMVKSDGFRMRRGEPATGGQ